MPKRQYFSRQEWTSPNYFSNNRSNDRNVNGYRPHTYNPFSSNFRMNSQMNYIGERHFTRAVPIPGKSNNNSMQISQKELIKISIENKKNKQTTNENPLNYRLNSTGKNDITKQLSTKNCYKENPTYVTNTDFKIEYSKKISTFENHESEIAHNSLSPKKRKIDEISTPKTKTSNFNSGGRASLQEREITQIITGICEPPKVTIEPEAELNPHLKSLEYYDKDLAQVKVQIASQLKLVRETRDKFNKEYDVLKELKIVKKTLVQKVKKICKALTKEDNDTSDTSDNEDKIGKPNEIIDLESSSESEDAAQSCDDDSSEVEIISETPKKSEIDRQTPKKSADPHVIPLPQKSFNSSDTVMSKTNSSKNSKSCPSTSLKTSPHKTPRKLLEKNIDVVTISKKGESKNKNVNENNEGHNKLPISNISKISSLADVKPLRARENVSESCRSLPSLNIPPGFDMQLRADADNGLFNAIEPTLDTIVVSDQPDCCITDVKIFNNRLFISASHGLLRQYNLVNHNCVMDYLGHSELVHCILPTAHPAGIKRLISGGFDQKLLIHDIDTGSILKQVPCDRPIMAICDLHDYVYFGTGGGSIVTYSLEKDKNINTFQASTSGISCLTATKEGYQHMLFVGFNDGEYCIFDAITFIKIKVITPMAFVEHPIGFVLLQKQRVLAFTKHHVHFIYYAKSKNTTTFNHLPDLSSLCLTKNYAIVGEKTGHISVYKIKGSLIPKNPIKKIKNENYSIPSLTFYNNTIITGNRNGKICFNRLVES